MFVEEPPATKSEERPNPMGLPFAFTEPAPEPTSDPIRDISTPSVATEAEATVWLWRGRPLCEEDGNVPGGTGGVFGGRELRLTVLAGITAAGVEGVSVADTFVDSVVEMDIGTEMEIGVGAGRGVSE